MRVENFSLQHTLESGQFFRYYKEGDWYHCRERDKNFKLRQQGNNVEFEGTTQQHIEKLFGLKDDYSSIIKELSKDKKLLPALKQYHGLRLMNRDPWETLVSFQCSIQSNIKKIQLNMNKLADAFGNGNFPEPGKLNDLEKIKNCSTGFRAKYIHKANDMVTDDSLAKLSKKSYAEAHEELLEIPGVGNKVADCICLFALNKKEAFPVDVWMERVMKEQYCKETHKDIKEFAKKQWGNNSGYAQQFLYHWSRCQPTKK